MDQMTVRVGIRRAKSPARDLYRIPARERADDGRTLLHVGDHTPICADCGRGRLLWAEAGYVPWHRICEVCGSHWELHPVTWGPARPMHAYDAVLAAADPQHRSGGLVHFVQGRGDVPLDPDESITEAPYTWGDVVALLTPENWRAAEQDAPRMAGSVVVPFCWARRARFYSAR